MEGNIVNYITQIRGVSYKPSDLHDSLNENSIILLRANNIVDGKINFEDVVYVDKSKVSETQILRENDVLICASSGSKNLVGKAASFNGNIECTFGAFCKVIRPRNILGSYLSAFFQSKYYRFHISQFANGANINNIKNEHINSFSIPERTLEEQKEISYKVFSLKRVIEKYNRELELLDELVKARFVEMFGDPVTNDMLWNTDVLKDICTKIGSGSTPRGGKESYIDEGISLIRSMNVHNAHFEYKDLAHITLDQAEKLNNVVVEHDDLLFNITGASVARCCVVPSDVLPARVNQHVCILRCREKINPIFLQGLLVNENYQGKLLQIAKSGATREAINKQQLESLEIMIPPLELQNQFASFVQEIDKSRLRELLAIKQIKLLLNDSWLLFY